MPNPDFFSSATPLFTCLSVIPQGKRFEFLNHNVAPGQLIATLLKHECTVRQQEQDLHVHELADILSCFTSAEQVQILAQEKVALPGLLNNPASQVAAFCCFPAAAWGQLMAVSGSTFHRDLLTAFSNYREETENGFKEGEANAAIAIQKAVETLVELKAAIDLFKRNRHRQKTTLYLLVRVPALNKIVSSLDEFFAIQQCCEDISVKDLLFLLGKEWALTHLNSTDALVRIIRKIPRDKSWSIKSDWKDVQAFLKENYMATVTCLTAFAEVYEACEVFAYSSSEEFESDKCIPTVLLQVALPLFKNQDDFRVLCRVVQNAGELKSILADDAFKLKQQVPNLEMLLIYLDAISNGRNDKKRELYPVQEYFLNQFADNLLLWVTTPKQLLDLEKKLVTDEASKFLYTTLNGRLPALIPHADDLFHIRAKYNLPQDKKPGFLAGFFGAPVVLAPATIATPKMGTGK